MKKKAYEAPRVLKTVTLLRESILLKGSVVTKDTEIKSMGQKEITYDFSGSSFNQEWE